MNFLSIANESVCSQHKCISLLHLDSNECVCSSSLWIETFSLASSWRLNIRLQHLSVPVWTDSCGPSQRNRTEEEEGGSFFCSGLLWHNACLLIEAVAAAWEENCDLTITPSFFPISLVLLSMRRDPSSASICFYFRHPAEAAERFGKSTQLRQLNRSVPSGLHCLISYLIPTSLFTAPPSLHPSTRFLITSLTLTSK